MSPLHPSEVDKRMCFIWLGFLGLMVVVCVLELP